MSDSTARLPDDLMKPNEASAKPAVPAETPSPEVAPAAVEGTDAVKILIVDDRADKIMALESVLSDLHQEIVKVNSGRQALRALLHDDYAVILLDVHMPEMDGFETAALIRQRRNSEKTPIIFVTAISDAETHIGRGYSLGAVDYIRTPIEPEPHLQTQLFTKVILSLMLGRSARTYLDTQRAAHMERMRQLTELRRTGGSLDGLLADHGLFHLEADLRWIDLTEARLDAIATAIEHDEEVQP